MLIDECDKPILDVLDNRLTTEVDGERRSIEDVNREILKGFYSVFKAADEDLQFVLLTGVTKFSQVSVFSGFNQPADISMDRRYEALCGITETELYGYFDEAIKELAVRYKYTEAEMKEFLKRQYDGYHFSDNLTDIYNPFSLLNAFASQRVDDYWFRSGTPSYLIRLLNHSEEDLDELTGRYYDPSEFIDYKADVEKPLPMIYQSGYLTVKDCDLSMNTFLLDFPNNEVRKGFVTLVANNYMKAKDDSGTIDAKNITAYILNKKAGRITATETVTGNATNKGYLKAKNITGTDAITCNSDHCVCVPEGPQEHEVTVLNEGQLIVEQTITGSACNWGEGEAITVTGTLRNVGQMQINNVPSFSNKQKGTLTFRGGVAGEKGAANRGGIVNVNGATTFKYFYNDGGTVNFNADVTITKEAENGNAEHTSTATITVAKDKIVKVKDPAVFKNCKSAIINVEGNLGDNVQNSGVIYVKAQGQLIANGIVETTKKLSKSAGVVKGIIDVTAADGTENDAQKARDMVAGGSQETNEGADKSNAFRYTIKKSTNAAELAADLKSRISSSNFLDNEVIIEFDANSKINYYGEFVKTLVKISHVLVKSGTQLTFTATGDTKKVNFPFLHNTQDPSTFPAYNAFEVASGAKLMVADNVKVTLPEIDFWANGEVNANDHSTLEGAVTIKGAGKFWNSTANCAWTLDGTEWTGEDYGF